MKLVATGIMYVAGIFCCLNSASAIQDKSIGSTVDKSYLGFELGYSLSMNGNLDVSEEKNGQSGFLWDHAPEGWNHRLDNTFIYGAFFGYNFSRLISLELAYNYRPSFKYAKFQTAPPGSSIGDRVRHFDLENRTLMLNSIFHLSAFSEGMQNFQEKTGVEPFINLGAGLASNKVGNFYGEGVGIKPGVIFSKMGDKTTYSFAAQAGAGINMMFTHNWAMKVGYRFLYGGNFKTQNYVTDDPDNQHKEIPGSGNIANPWSGRLLANEVYATLSYIF